MKRAVTALVLGLLLASCRTSIAPALPPNVANRLGPVESLDLARASKSAPVEPPKEATDVHVPDRPPPPSRMDLDVEGVRELALVNNLGLKVQRFAPHIAREVYDEERAKFDAVFHTSIRAARERFGGTRPGSVTESRGVVVEPGITLPLRTGGSVSIGLPLTYDKTEYNAFPDEELHSTVLNFSYTQPLLRNAGRDVNMASICVARLQTRQEEARTKLFAIRVLANAERAYWELYAAEKEVEIRRRQYEMALKQQAQAERMVEEGAMPGIEVVRAKAGVARRVEGVIIAETVRKRRERALKVILNVEDMPVDSGTVLFVTSDPTPLGLDLDRQKLMCQAVANRMEMLELELQVAIDEVTLNVDRNRTLPNLALEFNYSFRGRSTDSLFTAIDRIQTDEIGDIGIGITFDQPIGRRAARARLRQSLLARGRTLADKRRQAQAIHQEVLDAVDQLEQDWLRVLAAKRDVHLSGETYKGEQRQFQLGTRTTTEVLEALDFLADAQTREVQALAAYQSSLVELAFATGTVLGMSRVRW